MKLPCSTPRSTQGASLIEFALVLPILLALIIGILFYGIAFVAHQAVNYAAESGAEAVVAIDPDAVIDGGNNVTALVKTQVNSRIRTALGYFPGVDEAFPADGSSVVAVRVADSSGCRNGGGGKSVTICVVDDQADSASRLVQVRLSPKFGQLWPGFPQSDYLPSSGYVRATGSAMVSNPPNVNGG